jgi:hypothetical protein
MNPMTSSWETSGASLVADLQRIFGERLSSVVAYGGPLDGGGGALTSLVLVSSLAVADLESCARRQPHWERAGIATPLLLPADEFHRSLDAFPLEFGEIMRAHHRLFGADPFAGLSVPMEALRTACETQIKSHLLHLREGFLETTGNPTAIARLVAASAPAFTALLRNVARLTDVSISDRMDATRAGARASGVPDAIVSELLALEHPAGVSASDPARLFPAYLDAVEQLARVVDTWRV